MILGILFWFYNDKNYNAQNYIKRSRSGFKTNWKVNDICNGDIIAILFHDIDGNIDIKKHRVSHANQLILMNFLYFSIQIHHF